MDKKYIFDNILLLHVLKGSNLGCVYYLKLFIIMKSQLFTLPVLLTGIISISTYLSDSIVAIAEDPINPQTLYDNVGKVITNNVANITSYILIPVGILMMIINIILILWALIAGEKSNVGGRIGAIIAGFSLVILGLTINTNRDKIFSIAP
jgi:hypothetical protein